ncbi:hypothetical protein [Streptomyces fradiae]|uniref:hypothetical protein n=1 Tax=Streptomyces fradiae TaxID=1906 RepID=UPI0029427BA5|nr:hypothetical protein [Streptomyces fradiae]WOI63446.1 hypothetical protein RYQ63_28220 [Streptomyces fradiae]
MSDYREERRRDQAAAARQRRQDAAAADRRRLALQREADERAARLREQQRAEAEQRRADKAKRRVERAARRAETLTPGRVYRTGTLALVGASAAAALPAQILHFVGISPMLLPLPLAIEGAAWVMAAGVAHADERGLPGWVRWLLRALVAAAAGFAAAINWSYGRHLPGLSEADATVAGAGLAAVSLLGPLVFEVRQWVSTLSASTGEGEERERRRHARRRRRDHRTVARLADRLLSAAPFGALDAEAAWARAWEIVHGDDRPGMTPDLHRRAVRSHTALTAARAPRPGELRERLEAGLRPLDWVLPTEADVVPIRRASSQVANQMPPAPKAPRKKSAPPRRRKGDTPRYSTAARVAAAETARRTASVSVPVGEAR